MSRIKRPKDRLLPFLFQLDDQASLESRGYKAIKLSRYRARGYRFIVMIAMFDYRDYDSTWMDDSAVGKHCLAPDVDIAFEHHPFKTQKGALRFIKRWWKAQP